jgi:hypothetical protein
MSLEASEVFQLEALENQNEMLKHLKGFQKWSSILTIAASATAVVISFVTLYLYRIEVFSH